MNNFMSDGAEYLSSGMKTMRGGTVEDIVQYLIGNRPDASQRQIVKDIFGISKHIPGVSARNAAKVGRFAGRIAPGLSAVGNVMDVADVLAGNDSLGNKAMDAASMGIGGTAGFFLGGPLGASMGASAGKALSDGAQFLLGGGRKKTEEELLQEALLKLNGGIG